MPGVTRCPALLAGKPWHTAVKNACWKETSLLSAAQAVLEDFPADRYAGQDDESDARPAEPSFLCGDGKLWLSYPGPNG